MNEAEAQARDDMLWAEAMRVEKERRDTEIKERLEHLHDYATTDEQRNAIRVVGDVLDVPIDRGERPQGLRGGMMANTKRYSLYVDGRRYEVATLEISGLGVRHLVGAPTNSHCDEALYLKDETLVPYLEDGKWHNCGQRLFDLFEKVRLDGPEPPHFFLIPPARI